MANQPTFLPVENGFIPAAALVDGGKKPLSATVYDSEDTAKGAAERLITQAINDAKDARQIVAWSFMYGGRITFVLMSIFAFFMYGPTDNSQRLPAAVGLVLATIISHLIGRRIQATI